MVVLSIGSTEDGVGTTACKLPYEVEPGVFEVTQSWCQADEGVHLLKFKKSGGSDMFPSGRAVVYTSTYTSAAGWTEPTKTESAMPISASGYSGAGGKRLAMARSEQMTADTDDDVHEVQLELVRADGSALSGLKEWGVTMIAPPVKL